ncbi:MAG TPA: hypothetical protein DER09_00710 [Prolixibacteraceae bacterium]|nr:hypothetical protein [Prolixibacteraceae bacterium]
MYAVILAGGKIGSENQLWIESNGLPKSMISVGGKPMIQWVLDAANHAKSVQQIIIVGPDDISSLKSVKPLAHIPDQGGIFENLAAAADLILKEVPGTEYFLSISADIPLITGDIIETLIAENRESGFDVFYNVVEQNVMETAFPGVKRTYMKFSDGRFCGADMHVMSTKAIGKLAALGFVQHRKNPFKLIAMAGIGTILRMVFYPLSLKNAEKIVEERFGIHGKPVINLNAEIAMDIDTLQHLEIVRETLVERNMHG